MSPPRPPRAQNIKKVRAGGWIRDVRTTRPAGGGCPCWGGLSCRPGKSEEGTKRALTTAEERRGTANVIVPRRWCAGVPFSSLFNLAARHLPLFTTPTIEVTCHSNLTFRGRMLHLGSLPQTRAFASLEFELGGSSPGRAGAPPQGAFSKMAALSVR